MAFTFTPRVRQLYSDCEALRRVTGTVYLISRLDNDDGSLRAMWDAPYTPDQINYFERDAENRWHALYGNIHKLQTEPRQAQLLNDRNKPVQGTAGKIKGSTLTSAARQGGGHAEEFFLRYLMGLANKGIIPIVIDLFISRIPCAATSMSWEFEFNGNLETLPAGCGPKLYEVIRRTARISWYLAWSEGYEGQNQAASMLQVNRIDGLRNARTGHISQFL
jgi:hypothetical protein